MIPVVIRHATDRRALALPRSFSIERQVDEKRLRRKPVQKIFRRRGHLPPRCEHVAERGRAHRTAGDELSLDVGTQHDALRPMQQVALLLPGQMADDPADRVHLPEVPGAVGLAHATQSAQPLPAGEAQLLDHRMRQDASPIQPVRIGTRRARPPRRPSQRHAGSPTR